MFGRKIAISKSLEFWREEGRSELRPHFSRPAVSPPATRYSVQSEDKSTVTVQRSRALAAQQTDVFYNL